MGIRRLATLFVLFALVTKLVSPCEASAAAGASVDASGAPIVKCHFLTTISSARGESDRAPAGQAEREGCSCALCEIGWSTLPPADNTVVVRGLAYHVAARAPPAQAHVPCPPNRGASPRGPPSFV